MSFFNKYNSHISTFIKKRIYQNKIIKYKNPSILIKIFDKPARKTLTLISNVISTTDWFLTRGSLIDKYKYVLDETSFRSLHNKNLWVFI